MPVVVERESREARGINVETRRGNGAKDDREEGRRIVDEEYQEAKDQAQAANARSDTAVTRLAASLS